MMDTLQICLYWRWRWSNDQRRMDVSAPFSI